MRWLLIFIFLSSTYRAFAQTNDTGKVYAHADIMPSPTYDLLTYIAENVKLPDSNKSVITKTRVIVRFMVDVDGSIKDVHLVKKTNSVLDEEALRIIKSMPPWEPAKRWGKPVKVYYTQPIRFELE